MERALSHRIVTSSSSDIASPHRAGGAVIIIGQRATCARVERQLDLLDPRPVTIGWVLATSHRPAGRGGAADGGKHGRGSAGDGASAAGHAPPILGAVDEMEAILARRRPALAIVSLPAAMTDLIQSIRTRLRRAGVPDRFFPTIEDQLDGVGPRTHFTVDVNDLLARPPRVIDEQSVAGLLAGRRVLITGAGGSIGSELARRAARYDPSGLFLVERSENALFEIDRQIARFHPALPRRPILHDVVLADATRGLFNAVRPEIILHAAAHKHVPMMEDHPAAAVDNNLFGTKSVADAAIGCRAERFVMISTDKAVNPTSIMGATKRLAEMYIQDAHRRAVTAFSMVRFGNVLGSSGSVLDVWARQVAEGGPLTVTDPRMTRYFMTIPEAAALVLQAAALADPIAAEAEVFVLNMGDPVNVLDMCCRYAAAHGLTAVLDHGTSENSPSSTPGAIRVVITGARPGEKLFEELARDSESLRPTRHRDIDIWGLPQPDPQDIERMVRCLSPDIRSSDPNELAEEIRGLVPEMRRPLVQARRGSTEDFRLESVSPV
ncbi:MAG: polysaccharide biosynthesis protein [Phycisphaeraceae bacterium]|nr:MAG: polysaccharide biosynthesis protein [Phycisphaeraceae bacterium]